MIDAASWQRNHQAEGADLEPPGRGLAVATIGISQRLERYRVQGSGTVLTAGNPAIARGQPDGDSPWKVA